MTKPLPNGELPAFPADGYSGLTKRELIAAMAMQGLIADGATIVEYVAFNALRMADGVLAALEQPGEKDD